MYRTYCVLVLLSLYAGMAYSFSWEIVTTGGSSNRLDFYDIDGTLTHTAKIMPTNGSIYKIIYDPVHDRVLYADSRNIYSFDIATKKNVFLIRDTNSNINYLAYDPATELLFWTELYQQLYSISLKPGLNNSKVNEKQLILKTQKISCMTVDSCGGFIDLCISRRQFMKVRFDGSQGEVVSVVFDNFNVGMCFDPDQKSHKLFWSVSFSNKYEYSDFNLENKRRIIVPIKIHSSIGYGMFASKEFIYLELADYDKNKTSIWKSPKNPPHDLDIESQLYIEYDKVILAAFATKYSIEDITRAHQNCDALKGLLPNNLVSTDVSKLCVHGTKVSGESRCECAQGYGGERCDYKISECHNYCFQGDYSVSAEGQPQCRCKAGHSGERCEVNVCQAYCLNDGVCSLSEENKPVCQCTGGHEGDRCEVPVFITKCVQTATMLKDFLNTDIPSVEGVMSKCVSTPSTVF